MNAAQAKTWLAQSNVWPRFFFADADAGTWYAGLGAKRTLRFDSPADLSRIESELLEFQATSETPVFGGLRFNPNQSSASEWAPFGAAYFFEPIEYETGTIETTAVVTPGSTLESTEPSQDFRNLFALAMQEMEAGSFEKIVLAQRSIQPALPDVWDIAIEPSSFSFCFEVERDVAFRGVTPELLFRQSGDQISCDALAGTRKRTENDDASIIQELLTDPKDQNEHKFVITHLTERLKTVATEIEVGETAVRTLPHLHHLHTPVAATLGAYSSVLSQIHPTPALAGFPTQPAMDWLGLHEPFDRGWYGGAIGVLGNDSTCFAVAIRSVLSLAKKTFVYAGAGVVATSTCGQEWDEIQSKRNAIVDRLPGAS